MSEINDRINYSEEMRLDSDNTLRVTDFVTPPTEVLRLSCACITANPDIPVDEAAKAVLDALDANIKVMVQKAVEAEREACAKVCDDWPNGRDDVYSIGVAIRARGQE
jgi:hypothetical protein